MACAAKAYSWELTRKRVPRTNGIMDYTCSNVSLCYGCELAVRSADLVHWTEEMKAEYNRKQWQTYDSIECVNHENESFTSRWQSSYEAILRTQRATQ